MRYLRNPPSNVAIFHLQLHSASMRRSRGTGWGGGWGGLLIRHVRRKAASRCDLVLHIGSGCRRGAFSTLADETVTKFQLEVKNTGWNIFFLFSAKNRNFLRSKILKVVGCQLFNVLHGCLTCQTECFTYPDVGICPHVDLEQNLGSLLKKEKKEKKNLDWTNFLSVTFKTDWLDFFYTALAFVTTKPNLLKACRLVLSYSDRVRMYQMGSFKAGSARLQTWKHRDPAALHWYGAGSIMKNISIVLILLKKNSRLGLKGSSVTLQHGGCCVHAGNSVADDEIDIQWCASVLLSMKLMTSLWRIPLNWLTGLSSQPSD